MPKSKKGTENKINKDKYFFVYFFENAQPYLPPERYRMCREKLNSGQIFQKVLDQYLFDNHLYF